MARPRKGYVCEDCGQRTFRRRNKRQARVCVDCGIQRHRDYCLSVARKEGPGYEVWLASNVAYLKRLTGAGV